MATSKSLTRVDHPTHIQPVVLPVILVRRVLIREYLIVLICPEPIANIYRSSQGRSISASVYSSYDENSRASAINLGKDAYEPVIVETPKKPQCWDHGCNGRQFSTFSNLLRHQREKSGTSQKSVCHRCGAEFTRKTARDGHLAHDKCKRT